MKFIADLHTHSKYARACSPKLTLPNIDAWCRVKGVDIASTGDFTHPKWFAELKEKLAPAVEIYGGQSSVATEDCPPDMLNGLYAVKPEIKAENPPPIPLPQKPTLFMVGAEIACIYSQGGRLRRVHLCVYAPDIEVAGKINAALVARGCKLAGDGRPIIGMSSKALLSLILEIDPRCVMIPTHAWTPWFAIFGSRSGFDSIEECFEELAPHIFAIETGLSSDPAMNWRVPSLDSVALTSHSDAHSLPNLGREADIFEGPENSLSYSAIMAAIKNAAPARRAQYVIPTDPDLASGERRDPSTPLRSARDDKLLMMGTIEFIPDEGRYHFDGHRACSVRLHPDETKRLKGICPKCKRPVTVGVLSRVEELAKAPPGRKPPGAPEFWSLVELDKIIAEAEGVRGRASKAVEKHFWDLVAKAGNEVNVLLNCSREELARYAAPRVVEAIIRVREGKVSVDPGYDGEYGVVKIFSDAEKAEQKKLL